MSDIRVQFDRRLCVVRWTTYKCNGRTAIRFDDAHFQEPVAQVTINLPDQDHLLGPNEVFVNGDIVRQGLLDELYATGLLEPTNRSGRSGYSTYVIARLLVRPPAPPAPPASKAELL